MNSSFESFAFAENSSSHGSVRELPSDCCSLCCSRCDTVMPCLALSRSESCTVGKSFKRIEQSLAPTVTLVHRI